MGNKSSKPNDNFNPKSAWLSRRDFLRKKSAKAEQDAVQAREPRTRTTPNSDEEVPDVADITADYWKDGPAKQLHSSGGSLFDTPPRKAFPPRQSAEVSQPPPLSKEDTSPDSRRTTNLNGETEKPMRSSSASGSGFAAVSAWRAGILSESTLRPEWPASQLCQDGPSPTQPIPIPCANPLARRRPILILPSPSLRGQGSSATGLNVPLSTWLREDPALSDDLVGLRPVTQAGCSAQVPDSGARSTPNDRHSGMELQPFMMDVTPPLLRAYSSNAPQAYSSLEAPRNNSNLITSDPRGIPAATATGTQADSIWSASPIQVRRSLFPGADTTMPPTTDSRPEPDAGSRFSQASTMAMENMSLRPDPWPLPNQGLSATGTRYNELFANEALHGFTPLLPSLPRLGQPDLERADTNPFDSSEFIRPLPVVRPRNANLDGPTTPPQASLTMSLPSFNGANAGPDGSKIIETNGSTSAIPNASCVPPSTFSSFSSNDRPRYGDHSCGAQPTTRGLPEEPFTFYGYPLPMHRKQRTPFAADAGKKRPSSESVACLNPRGDEAASMIHDSLQACGGTEALAPTGSRQIAFAESQYTSVSVDGATCSTSRLHGPRMLQSSHQRLQGARVGLQALLVPTLCRTSSHASQPDFGNVAQSGPSAPVSASSVDRRNSSVIKHGRPPPAIAGPNDVDKEVQRNGRSSDRSATTGTAGGGTSGPSIRLVAQDRHASLSCKPSVPSPGGTALPRYESAEILARYSSAASALQANCPLTSSCTAPAPPITRWESLCGHHTFISSSNRRAPTDCMGCHRADGDRWQCSICGLRICGACRAKTHTTMDL